MPAAEKQQTRPDVVSVNAAARKERRALPEHLPREVQTHETQHDSCPACCGQLSKLGERRIRSARIRTGALQSHSACAAKAELQEVGWQS